MKPTLVDLQKADADMTKAIREHIASGNNELAAEIKRDQRKTRALIEELEKPLRDIESPTHLHE